MRDVRVALLILAVPAVYNFICFSFIADAPRIEPLLRNVYRAFNATGFIAIVAAVWFIGLAGLEFVTAALHAVFARKSEVSNWKTALYQTLRRAPVFAFLGAVLWAMWTAAFYQLNFGFYAVSVPIAIAAHVLAAGLYVPLICQWYRIDRAPT
jgi:hypothetical protein